MKDDRFLLVALAILGFVSFLILKPFMTYILFSIILAIVAYPVYERLKSKTGRMGTSAIIVILLIISIVIVPSVFLTIEIFGQAQDIITNVYSADFSNLEKVENKLESVLGFRINFAEKLRIQILDLSSVIRLYIVSNIVTFTRTVASFLAGIVVMLFVMFYFFIDGKVIIEQIKRFLPIEDKYKIYLLNKTHTAIQGLFLGLFLTAIIQAILAGLGYAIFGVENVILLAFLTGLFALVPLVGPPAVYVPVSIYLLINGNIIGGIGLLAYGVIVVSQIDNLIRPKMVRLRSKIHPLYVILGVVGGVSLFGFSGVIIGPLILTVFQEVLEVYQLSKKRQTIQNIP